MRLAGNCRLKSKISTRTGVFDRSVRTRRADPMMHACTSKSGRRWKPRAAGGGSEPGRRWQSARPALRPRTACSGCSWSILPVSIRNFPTLSAGRASSNESTHPSVSCSRRYAEELNRQNHERRAHTELDRKALAKVERGIAGIMAAIEDGMYQPAMKARMDDLERQKAEIMARMAEAPADVPDVHPNIAEIYKAKVVHLTEALADPELHSEAADRRRSGWSASYRPGSGRPRTPPRCHRGWSRRRPRVDPRNARCRRR